MTNPYSGRSLGTPTFRSGGYSVPEWLKRNPRSKQNRIKSPRSRRNQSAPSATSAPSGGNLSSQFSGDAFGSDATALQSDAMSGQIYGGTSEQRVEAASLAGDSAPPKSGGGESGGAGIAAGIGVGAAVLDDLDTDNKYGGADVGKSALKYAGMGASLGSVIPGVGTAIGAAGGALIGGIVGLVKKRKFEKEATENKQKERSERVSKETRGLATAEAESFYQNQTTASSGYGGADVDKFINKYS